MNNYSILNTYYYNNLDRVGFNKLDLIFLVAKK